MTASDTARAPCASAEHPRGRRNRANRGAVLGGQRGALGGLEQHRTPGGQSTDRVHHGVGHGVVPRRDDPDCRPRPVMHGDLLDGQERQRGRPGVWRHRLLDDLDVVREDHDQQRDLLRGIHGGLAGLGDQEFLDLVAVVAQPHRVAGEHFGAALRAACPPPLLSFHADRPRCAAHRPRRSRSPGRRRHRSRDCEWCRNP